MTTDIVTQNKSARPKSMRNHDYFFDSNYIVSGEKDHNKIITRTAINTAHINIVPIYEHMFSELKTYPSIRRDYILNAYLPSHVDLSYSIRLTETVKLSTATVCGRERFKFYSAPKSALPLVSTEEPIKVVIQSPEQFTPKCLFVDKCVQTQYRENSTQTDPYQPEFKIREGCSKMPEVLMLENVHIDSEDIQRGINKSIVLWVKRQKAKRAWIDIEPTTSILSQLEYCEQRHREMDIEYALSQLKTTDHISNIISRIDSQRPSRFWQCRSEVLEKNIEKIRKQKERDLRKLEAKRFEYPKDKINIIKYHEMEKLPRIILNSSYLTRVEKIEKNLSEVPHNKDKYQKFGNMSDEKLAELQQELTNPEKCF